MLAGLGYKTIINKAIIQHTMNITKGKMSRPQRVVIYGAEGVGKSTLAAVNAPCPIFLDTEDGSCHLDVERVAIHTLSDLSEALRELLAMRKAGSSAYESVVLDTADRLWTMCAEAVCAENAWSSIETPGYGRGYALAAERFRAVFGGFDALMRAGYHVVIVCHAKTDRVMPPDNPEYTKYMIKVSAPTKQAEVSREFIKEWCDALLFCHFDVTVDAEKRRALGRDARRVISTEPSPAWEAKNRLGLPAELPMEAGTLKGIFGIDYRQFTIDEQKDRQAAPAGGGEPAAAPVELQRGEPAAEAVELQRGEPQNTVFMLAGRGVEMSNADAELLTAYFVGTGKLAAGQTIEELPGNIQNAVASRTEQAVAAARAWAKNKTVNQ